MSCAFGPTVLTMAYAGGHISGGHFNPAVTLGLWSAGRCANRHVLPYIVALLAGALTRWMYEPEVLIDTIVVEERGIA